MTDAQMIDLLCATLALDNIELDRPKPDAVAGAIRGFIPGRPVNLCEGFAADGTVAFFIRSGSIVTTETAPAVERWTEQFNARPECLDESSQRWARASISGKDGRSRSLLIGAKFDVGNEESASRFADRLRLFIKMGRDRWPLP